MIGKLKTLGFSTTNRPQTVRISTRNYSTLILNTKPARVVSGAHLFCLAVCCTDNNLQLNVNKRRSWLLTSEKESDTHHCLHQGPWVNKGVAEVEQVNNFIENLSCSSHISILTENAQKWLYFLMKFKKAKFPCQVFVNVCRGIIESVLTGNIPNWHVSCMTQDTLCSGWLKPPRYKSEHQRHQWGEVPLQSTKDTKGQQPLQLQKYPLCGSKTIILSFIHSRAVLVLCYCPSSLAVTVKNVTSGIVFLSLYHWSNWFEVRCDGVRILLFWYTPSDTPSWFVCPLL